MAELVQTYIGELDKWIPGMETIGDLNRRTASRVNAVIGRPQIVDFVFDGVWAAADTATLTIAGVAQTPTVLAAGEDTIAEARDAVLADAILVTEWAEFGTFSASGTDTLRWTSKEMVVGSGRYFSVSFDADETTAGSGAITPTETQARRNRGDMPFGIGVALDTTDSGGQRAILPAGSGAIFGGGTIYGAVYENRSLSGDDGIPAHEGFPGMLQGYMAARVDSDVIAAIAAGSRNLFWKHTADGLGPLGYFRHNNTNAIALRGRFTGRVQTSGGVNLAEVLFNEP